MLGYPRTVGISLCEPEEREDPPAPPPHPLHTPTHLETPYESPHLNKPVSSVQIMTWFPIDAFEGQNLHFKEFV